MEDSYWIISPENGGHITLRCLYLRDLYNGWEDGYSLLFVLNGTIEALNEGEGFLLRKEDLFLVNERTPYALKSEGEAVALVLALDTKDLLPEAAHQRFRCNSVLEPDEARYLTLKRFLAELVKTNATEVNQASRYANLSLMFGILGELSAHFAIENSIQGSNKHQERIAEIFRFIEEHWREGIALKDVASAVGLTVPYLSSFFEKRIGITFLAYYTEFRLSRAVRELLTSDRSIEDIALSHGFTDPRSFVNAFKKKYGVLPSLYRKKAREGQQRINYAEKKPSKTVPETGLEILAKYLKQDEKRADAISKTPENPPKTLNPAPINVSHVIGTLKHNFKTFTSVGRAKELLYSDVQEMLRELQAQVGFEYIKFHGILSDDMLVYRETEDGEPQYSFVLIDKAIDFLLSIHLKPLIEFSFMPKDLARPNANQVFASPFYISAPKSFEKWGKLIDALMEHLVERYSLRVVRTWLFSVWNEPDTSTSLFGLSDDQDYFKMYKIAYEIVKKYSSQCKVGTPSLIYSYRVYSSWIDTYLKWCLANACRPDFINIHYYDNDFTFDTMSLHSPANPAHSRLNMDPDSFGKAIVDIKNHFDEIGIGDLPIYMTEWNLTVSHRNLLNDTCFKSCYLAKNLLENYDELNSFGYWVLTDFLEETQPSENEFHGGLGLFTYSKIKKPHYFTFDFLSRLGNSLIAKGPGYFVAKRHGCVQVFLYNYEHFNHLFASGQSFDATYLDRYAPFSTLGKMDVDLKLVGFGAKKCRIVTRSVNQKYGSAFDLWTAMGAPKMDEELLSYLRTNCMPKIDFKDIAIEEGTVEVKALLDPLEIRLVEIRY